MQNALSFYSIVFLNFSIQLWNIFFDLLHFVQLYLPILFLLHIEQRCMICASLCLCLWWMRFTFASPLHQLVSSFFRQLHPPELHNLIFYDYIFVHISQPAVQFVIQPCFNSTQNYSTATQVHGSHLMSELHSDLWPIFHLFSSKTSILRGA